MLARFLGSLGIGGFRRASASFWRFSACSSKSLASLTFFSAASSRDEATLSCGHDNGGGKGVVS